MYSEKKADLCQLMDITKVETDCEKIDILKTNLFNENNYNNKEEDIQPSAYVKGIIF